jgi:hypothetical protein
MTAAPPLTAMKVSGENRPLYERAMLLLERNQPNDVWAMMSPLLSKSSGMPRISVGSGASPRISTSRPTRSARTSMS